MKLYLKCVKDLLKEEGFYICLIIAFVALIDGNILGAFLMGAVVPLLAALNNFYLEKKY
jgi:hypothetical protein